MKQLHKQLNKHAACWIILMFSKIFMDFPIYTMMPKQNRGHFSDGMLEKHFRKGLLSDSNATNVYHYRDVIMGAMASQITGVAIVYSTVCSGKKSTKTSKLRVTGLCERNSPVNSPHKGPVMQKMFPFDDVIMFLGVHITLTRGAYGWAMYTMSAMSIWEKTLSWNNGLSMDQS